MSMLGSIVLLLAMAPAPLEVGAAAVDLIADDAMVIGGGILPGYAKGQEGKLRATAIVVSDGKQSAAIVACDILMIERDILDDAARRIEAATQIPFANILINATHTHSAPTTCTVHGYRREEGFAKQVGDAIVRAVTLANDRRKTSLPHVVKFRLGEEKTVGQNSRLALADGTIFWVGSRADAVGPTGPFDPQLPVLAFVRADHGLTALLFGHSTHTIGTRATGKRSPCFYGLAAQELETELGGTVLFLEGASGSTHNLTLTGAEAAQRIHAAVRDTYARTEPVAAAPIAAIKREISVRVRTFDELKEDAAVRSYCSRRIPDPKGAEQVANVFRDMRRTLSPLQGKERKTWVQTIRLGDIAIVGVPAEFFTVLGIEIKRQSPFRGTIIAELANDWIGYVGDRPSYDKGGYQLWMGLHSYTAPGTGEQIVGEAVRQLKELASSTGPAP